MKQKILIVLGIWLFANCFAYGQNDVEQLHSHLKVTLASGDFIHIPISGNPVITNTGLGLLFEYDTESFEFEWADLSHLEFIGNLGAVDNIDFESKQIIFDKEAIHLSGFKSGERVNIYTIDGLIIYTTATDSTGSQTLDINHLKSGTYIVSIANQTIKIKK